MYRHLKTHLQSAVKQDRRVVLLLGARQVGKTTLLKNTFPHATYINIEKSNYIDIFNSRNLGSIARVIRSEQKQPGAPLILDEVQRLDDPGLVAKLIHDELSDISLIISGSSALEIAHKASESLAGRKITLKLFPLTFAEMMVQKGQIPTPTSNNSSFFEKELSPAKSYLEQILHSMRYGLFPETLNTQNSEEYLLELVDSVIFKDVSYLNLVKNTKNLYSLLKLLAYQIGQQVNITDLASRIGISRTTVLDYISIMEQTYILYRLGPFTKKRRDEIGKTEKIFFHDLGLRNAVINDFSPVEYRRDFGSVFENFVMNEILKLNSYNTSRYSMYYWRTTWGSEVDLVLMKDHKLKAFEIKTRQGTITKAFTNTYPEARTAIITLDNVASLLL